MATSLTPLSAFIKTLTEKSDLGIGLAMFGADTDGNEWAVPIDDIKNYEIVTGDCATAGNYKIASIASENLTTTDLLLIKISDNNPTASARKLCSFIFSPNAVGVSQVGTILSSKVNADTTLNPSIFLRDSLGLYINFGTTFSGRTITIEKIGKNLSDDSLVLITPTSTFSFGTGLKTKSILTTNIDDFFGSVVPLLDSANIFSQNQAIETEGITTFALTSYRSSTFNHVYFACKSAAGTKASPTPLLSGASIGTLAMLPYDGTDFQSDKGGIEFRASQNHSASALGTEAKIKVVPNSTAVQIDGLVVPNNGVYNNNLSTSGRAVRILSTNVIGTDGSSIRYKRDIEDLEDDYIEKIFSSMSERYFKMKNNSGYPEDWGYIGYIAEELALVAPELCTWGYWPEDYEEVEVKEEVEIDVKGKLKKVTKISKELRLKKDAKLSPDGVQYDRLGVVALAILRKQEAKIKAQDERIASLEKRLEALEKKLK